MSRFTSFMSRAGGYSIIGTCFFIPLSTSLMGLFGALVVLFWLFSCRIKNIGQLLIKSPVAVIALVLTVLFFCGILYTPVSLDDAVDALKKYRELIYIPIIMSLLGQEQQFGQKAVMAFFIGCIILLCISYAMAGGILPSARYGHSLTYHITHSFFMAILAFWTLHRLFDADKYRIVWGLLFVAVVGNIIYIAPGRTGMLTFLILCLLFLWQRLSWKKMVTGLIFFGLLIIIAVFSSQNFTGRLQEAQKEIQTYQHGISRTSLGMRFDWWYGSLKLIEEKPFLGHGTGSFAHDHDLLIKGTKTKSTDNPHNEYLFIAVQLGVVGLFVFLALFAAQWYCSYFLSLRERWLVQGVIVSMAAGCLMNSFLFDSHQGHYFAFLSAALLAPYGELQQKYN